ncbi:MAG: hypothetical protein Q7R96_03975 [Nanoarchaeota archaeon]|nr:hypothetical protein [Nanoarchaeota archaeon]
MDITITPETLKKVLTDYPVITENDPHNEMNYNFRVFNDGTTLPHIFPAFERIKEMTGYTGNETHFRLFIPYNDAGELQEPGIVVCNFGGKTSVPIASLRGHQQRTHNHQYWPIINVHTHPSTPSDFPLHWIPIPSCNPKCGDLREAKERYIQYARGNRIRHTPFMNREINIVLREDDLFIYQILTDDEHLSQFIDETYPEEKKRIIHYLEHHHIPLEERIKISCTSLAEAMERSGVYRAHYTTLKDLKEQPEKFTEKFTYTLSPHIQVTVQ